jgi:YfiH family protein
MAHDGEVLTAARLSSLRRVRHGFFTRQGGVSQGLYESLNCGLGSRDDTILVAENRARVARALSSGQERVSTLHQVHSATALLVDRPIDERPLPRADALVTRTPGVVIGALAADCTPVLFADGEAGIVAAAHAGWRGALAGVVEATIACMMEAGAQRTSIHAAIGPCINQRSYEVGPEFQEEFLNTDAGSAAFFTQAASDARPRFDLPGYIEGRLARAGLASVERQSPCTYENESLFFSYRRSQHRKEADYGRQISAIVLS